MTKGCNWGFVGTVAVVTTLVSIGYGIYVTKEKRKLERQIDLISDKFEECINDYNSSQDSSEDNNTLDS